VAWGPWPLASDRSAPGATTTTGHGARRETSAETLPSSDERGPVEPTTIRAAFCSAATATRRSAGWPTSTSQCAPQSTSVALSAKWCSRAATAAIFSSAVAYSTTRTNTSRRRSFALNSRATRAAPLADSESSTPQMIEQVMRSSFIALSQARLPRPRRPSGCQPIWCERRRHPDRPRTGESAIGRARMGSPPDSRNNARPARSGGAPRKRGGPR
jgi:hypothetical protein